MGMIDFLDDLKQHQTRYHKSANSSILFTLDKPNNVESKIPIKYIKENVYQYSLSNQPLHDLFILSRQAINKEINIVIDNDIMCKLNADYRVIILNAGKEFAHKHYLKCHHLDVDSCNLDTYDFKHLLVPIPACAVFLNNDGSYFFALPILLNSGINIDSQINLDDDIKNGSLWVKDATLADIKTVLDNCSDAQELDAKTLTRYTRGNDAKAITPAMLKQLSCLIRPDLSTTRTFAFCDDYSRAVFHTLRLSCFNSGSFTSIANAQAKWAAYNIRHDFKLYYDDQGELHGHINGASKTVNKRFYDQPKQNLDQTIPRNFIFGNDRYDGTANVFAWQTFVDNFDPKAGKTKVHDLQFAGLTDGKVAKPIAPAHNLNKVLVDMKESTKHKYYFTKEDDGIFLTAFIAPRTKQNTKFINKYSLHAIRNYHVEEID